MRDSLILRALIFLLNGVLWVVILFCTALFLIGAIFYVVLELPLKLGHHHPAPVIIHQPPTPERK